MSRVRTCLWFHEGGPEAAAFYVTLLPDSRVERVMTFDGGVSLVEFVLGGTPYQILSAGPHQTLSPAVSISVLTEDQAETDRLWDALTADGGSEVACGWLTDRYGVSWQIVPRRLLELQADPDRERAARVHAAMQGMVKIDVAALEAA